MSAGKIIRTLARNVEVIKIDNGGWCVKVRSIKKMKEKIEKIGETGEADRVNIRSIAITILPV